ncbi:nucleotidyltransferase family protein [Aureimonas leprariae]|uniref:Nucleotidyltransferase family protein n=1 Tax=Plantimonas leprariae TaxID=2615207 RepID=A0A7V7PQU9_9HYPH|nr:nucleotidyltransferase family protein [Aureimonas leprariae]KAB0680816.1 nucleotidyltransferase family protein [Aureimonas leprariae]
MEADSEFLAAVRDNRRNRELLVRLRRLGLDDCFLVAGCLFQSFWNRLSGLPPEHGIRDYDIFYHDGSDLSFEAEDAVVRRVHDAVADLGIAVDVKNQARVHLWYEGRFGHRREPLRDCCDGIDRYLVACTCVGIDVRSGAIYAPNGLADLRAGILRPNPKSGSPAALFAAKAADYRARWPWLRIEPDGALGR